MSYSLPDSCAKSNALRLISSALTYCPVWNAAKAASRRLALSSGRGISPLKKRVIDTNMDSITTSNSCGIGDRVVTGSNGGNLTENHSTVEESNHEYHSQNFSEFNCGDRY